MKAVVLKKHGPARVLKISDIPETQPGESEVRVRIRTIGLNYAEVLSRRGLYGWAPKLPYIPGMEACGEIIAVGSGVPDRNIGERVIVGGQYGAYAESIVIPAVRALPALEHFTDEENAAFAVNYITAWVSLFSMARLRPGERVLVNAAAGGVGTAAVQLASKYGAVVFGAAGSSGKFDLLHRLGVEAAFNYREQDIEKELLDRTDGRGVDVVLEMVGGDVFRKSVRLLAPFGRLVVVGFAGLNLQKWNPLSWWRTFRDMPKIKIGTMLRRSINIGSSHIGYLLEREELILALWSELVDFVRRQKIRPVIGRVFPFDEIARAHELMESRGSTGKIVLRV